MCKLKPGDLRPSEIELIAACPENITCSRHNDWRLLKADAQMQALAFDYDKHDAAAAHGLSFHTASHRQVPNMP